MADIPEDKTIEGTIPLLFSDGYDFILKRSKEYQSNIFETRLMGEKTICMIGEEAAKLFYDEERMQREGAIPNRIKESLFGKGSVQTMEGQPHRHRKALYMSLMSRESLDRLYKLSTAEWQKAADRWSKKKEVVLFDEAQEVLSRAVCTWAGVPLQEEDVKERTEDFAEMVDSFGAVGPRHWQGRTARNRAEKWMQDIIRQIRSGEIEVDEEQAAYKIALHEDLDGHLLPAKTAAVMLLNVLRPTVAIA